MLMIASWMVGAVIWLWCIGFTCCADDNIPTWIARVIAGAIAIGFPFLLFRLRRKPWIALAALAVLFVFCQIAFRTMTPRHDRVWGDAQATLPFAEFPPAPDGSVGGKVVVKNIRSLRYGPIAPNRPNHFDETFELSKLKSVWFGVDRFTSVKPVAHTFVSFEFEPGSHRTNFLAFSVETRREKDELIYSPIRGLFNNYETIYVIADEEDVLSVRSDVQEHVVQLYPVRATREQARSMLIDMLERANGIRETPEFYHTLTSNCTNNIVYHTNKVLEEPVSAWERGVLFPGYSDWLAYRLGIIDTDLPLAEAREKFRIDQRVKQYDGRGGFSEFIRGRE